MNIHHVLCVGKNTYKEVIRDKVYYVFFFFSLFVMLFSSLLGRLSIGETRVFIMDFSFFAMEITGVLISIFVGITLVYREIEQKTVFNILSKPVRRSEFIVGKFTGLFFALLLVETLMFVCIVFFLFYKNIDVSPGSLVVFGSILLKIIMILSCAVLFSVVSSPLVSGMFTLFFYVIGSVSYQIKHIYHVADSSVLQRVVYSLIPNFKNLDFSYQYVHMLDIDPKAVLVSWTYGIVYALTLLVISTKCFERKDLL
ncbi:ABC transporter permease [Desulfoluna butyratoxydans]|uniref:Abc-2 family transporter protein n=1 Tax=Desulfoluna butyratoxydans TaxID=231438 RepID=A0A4U8YSE6_9BACT|nr:ABC transporter permease subunit [Desulfoluna butyratoxydans]VFQ47286.1 abc-2 family transporter protein [Desulfoluna butyratoxydans]